MGCKIGIAELMNRVVLNSTIQNVDAITENIVVWAFDAEKRIGTGEMFDKQEKLYRVNSTKFRIPDNIMSINDICIPGQSVVYTEGALKKKCGCSCDSCCCIKVAKNGKYLNFSTEVDDIWLDYVGIAVDEYGFPMIDEDHVDAIESYISFMLTNIRFKNGLVPQHVYRELKRTYLIKFRAANSHDKMPNDATRRRLDAIFNSKLPVHWSKYTEYVRSCCSSSGSGGSAPSSGGSGGGVSIVNNITNITNITAGDWTVVQVTGDGTDTYTNANFIGLNFNNDIFVYYDGTTLQLGTDVTGFDNTTGTITYAAAITNGKTYRIFYRVT